MKRVLTTLGVCFAIVATGAVLQAQQQQPQTPPNQQQQQVTPPQQPVPDVVLTGCLVQGSAPAVYLFDNARKDPKSTTEKPVKYLVVIVGEDLDLKTHINHEVQLTGVIDLKSAMAPKPGEKLAEKDLPRFNTKSVTMVSDTCGTVK